jgi:L-iditol 2-dehydrogenase
MKAVYLTGIGRFDVRQEPDPKIIHDTDVLVRIKAVGVCGSDIHYFTTGRIGSQVIEYPFIVGHEAGGIVEQVGKRVTRVRPGQRIAIDPAVSCGQCDQCKAGRENTCRTLRFMGAPKQMDGALREYVVIHENCCYPIGDALTFDQAAISEPLAITVYSVERSHLPPNGTAAILGCGPIGASLFHVLRTKNVGDVYVTDKVEERLAYAKTLKPRWTGNPDRVDVVKEVSRLEPLLMDVVYECSGDPAAIRQGVDLLKPGGSLVIVGITETDEVSFPIHELRRKEITILNIRRQVHCTQKALDLLSHHKISLDAMVTHRFPMEETGTAFELVANKGEGVMKAMISFE